MIARLLVLAVVGSCALSSSANAAAYTVSPCRVGVVPYPGSQLLLGDGATAVNNACSTGHGFQMWFAPTTNVLENGQAAGLRILIPGAFPHAQILQLSANVTLAERHGDAGELDTIDETNGGGVDQIGWGTGFTSQIGPVDYMQVPAKPTRSVIWRPRSYSTTTFDPTAVGADFVLNGLSLDLDDSTVPLPPNMAATGLLDGTPQTGKRILTIASRDEDAGVHDVTVNTPDAQLGILTGGCTYASVEACPTERDGDVVIDTSKLPDGPQTLKVTVIDAANNTFIAQTPRFTVANHTPPMTTPPTTPGTRPAGPQANGDGKGAAMVTADLTSTKGPSGRETKSTAFGRSITLRGRVLDAAGAPMASVQLDVLQTIATPGSTAARITSITTDAKGAYAYTFKAGASSDVVVAYPDHVGAGDYSASRTVRLSVRAGVTLHRSGVLRSGAKVRLFGHVSVTPMPSTGVHVAIQYHSRTGWQDIAFPRTSATGDYRWTHVFRTATQYRFRARVVRDPALAAAPNSSRELRIQIR